MPRQDWSSNNDFMTRERERGDDSYRDSGAFIGRDREDTRSHRRQGSWGSLMSDDSSGGRNMRDRSDYDRERSFGPDDYKSGIPTDETERLISSNKVEGTPVFDRNGDKLGSIHNFMVDKFRGRVVYAVLRHSSGFLGLDDRYYPLEWDQLRFDTRLGGYHVDMSEDQLKRSGSWDRNERWDDRGSRDSGRQTMRESW